MRNVIFSEKNLLHLKVEFISLFQCKIRSERFEKISNGEFFITLFTPLYQGYQITVEDRGICIPNVKPTILSDYMREW